MSTKRKAFKVRSGNSHITVAPWVHSASGASRWRYAYRPSPAAPWKYRSFTSKEAATASAERQLEAAGAIASPLDHLPPARLRFLAEIAATVTPADERRVLDFIAALGRSSALNGAVERFLTSKTSKAGEETPHVTRLRHVLTQLAAHFADQHIAEIHLPALQEWFDARTAATGWKRKKDIRANVIQFFRWCRKEGIAGNDPLTVAERLPEIGGQHGERACLTPEQFQRLAEAIREEYRPWLILGCFCGLRPEEIAPAASDKKSTKRGLRCEEIDWEFGVIRVSPETSKVGFPRIVPLSHAARAGLLWAGISPGMTGPVCMTNPAKSRELARLGKLVFADATWPQDICRHSYGSYRNAIIRSLGQVAEEMGTSVAMLQRHYHNPRAMAEGEQWFSLHQSVPICSYENDSTGPFLLASNS